MTYILKCLTNIAEFSRWFDVSLGTVGVGILLIYAFNIIVGTLPLFKVLRKTPAKIFARHDIE